MNTFILLEEATSLPPYAWVLIGLFAFLIILGTILFLLMSRKKRGNAPIMASAEDLSILGGKENIISKELRGSRIIISCKDFSKVDHEALKKAGVTGFIQASDKLTLVLKDGAEVLYNSLFKE